MSVMEIELEGETITKMVTKKEIGMSVIDTLGKTIIKTLTKKEIDTSTIETVGETITEMVTVARNEWEKSGASSRKNVKVKNAIYFDFT